MVEDQNLEFVILQERRRGERRNECETFISKSNKDMDDHGNLPELTRGDPTGPVRFVPQVWQSPTDKSIR
jgi:hypothetical protein